jgi:hypothetical protein
VKDAAIIVAALVVGFLMLGYDQRTDDTGVEAALLVATSLALAVAAPRRALAVGLGVGLPIPVWSVMIGNSAGVAALAFALFGAGLGWLMRRGRVAAV